MMILIFAPPLTQLQSILVGDQWPTESAFNPEGNTKIWANRTHHLSWCSCKQTLFNPEGNTKIKTNRVHHHLYMFLPLNIVKSPKKYTFHFAAFYQLLQSKFVFSGSLRRCSHPNALLARIHKVHKGAKQWHSWNNTGHCLQRFVSEVNSAKASSWASDHLPRALIITKVHWAKDGLGRE